VRSHIGSADEPWLRYIRGLEEWGERFPGFEGELEGADLRDGKYYIYNSLKALQPPADLHWVVVDGM